MLLDCGLMFPDADMPGIDLVLPDFTYLRENARPHRRLRRDPRPRGPRRRPVVPAPRRVVPDLRLAAHARARPQPHRGGRPARPHRARPGRATASAASIGPFDLEFIPVTHSVPHAFATAFHTPQGVILHSGDFKLDLTPVDGRLTDLSRIGAIASTDRRPAAAVRLDERRGGRPRAVRARRRSSPDQPLPPARRSADHHGVRSPATSTASSRSPTPRSPADASSPRSGCR